MRVVSQGSASEHVSDERNGKARKIHNIRVGRSPCPPFSIKICGPIFLTIVRNCSVIDSVPVNLHLKSSNPLTRVSFNPIVMSFRSKIRVPGIINSFSNSSKSFVNFPPFNSQKPNYVLNFLFVEIFDRSGCRRRSSKLGEKWRRRG